MFAKADSERGTGTVRGSKWCNEEQVWMDGRISIHELMQRLFAAKEIQMADGSLPTSKAGKQEIRTCLHGNAECMSMRLELNLASCSPPSRYPGL